MPPTTTERDHDRFLARRAAAGHSEAWDELIARYGGRVYSVAFQFTGDPHQAEDLCQDIFLRLFERLASYRGDVPLVAWALRLSRNLCIDHYRRCRRERRAHLVSTEVLAALPADDDPDRSMLRREELRLVYAALAEMSEDLATVIVLRDLQGWSYDEVAAVLELPLGTLKSRLNRARHELSSRLRRRVGGGRPHSSPFLAASC